MIGPEGGALTNEISGLMTETSESALVPPTL